MKKIINFIGIFILLSTKTMATYYDTGWQVFKQPDGTDLLAGCRETSTFNSIKLMKGMLSERIIKMDIIIM